MQTETTDYVSEESLGSDLEDRLYAQLYYSSHLNIAPFPVPKRQESANSEEASFLADVDSDVDSVEAEGSETMFETRPHIPDYNEEDQKDSKYHFRGPKEMMLANASAADTASDTDGDSVESSSDPSPFIKHRMTLGDVHLDASTTMSVPPSNELFSDDSEPDIPDDSRRYFLSDKSGPTCFNCGQAGHLNRDCPESNMMPCSLCGQSGHLKSNCPQELCYVCRQPGHIARSCPLAATPSTLSSSNAVGAATGSLSLSSRDSPRQDRHAECPLCTLPGHKEAECSLHWRVYLSSLARFPSDKEISQTLYSLNHFCYNCSSKSHFGDDCSRKRIRSMWTAFNRYSIDYVRRSLMLKNNRHVGPMEPLLTDTKGREMHPKDVSSLPARQGRFVYEGHGGAVAQQSMSPQSRSQPQPHFESQSQSRPPPQRHYEGPPKRPYSPATPGAYKPLLPSPGDYELPPRRDVVVTDAARPSPSKMPAENVYMFRHGNQEAHEPRIIDHRQRVAGMRGGRATRRGSGRVPSRHVSAASTATAAATAAYTGNVSHPSTGYRYARGQRRY